MLNAADAAFLDTLASQLPPGRLREAEPRHLSEPRGKWVGRPGPVALIMGISRAITPGTAVVLGADYELVML